MVFYNDNGVDPHFHGLEDILLINDEQLSEEGIGSLFLSMDPHMSSAPNEIHNRFLKRYAALVFKYLFHIFQRFLSWSIIPEEWNIAKLVPVFKYCDISLVNNYIPIPLISTCGKHLEHIISQNIKLCLEQNLLLPLSNMGLQRVFRR